MVEILLVARQAIYLPLVMIRLLCIHFGGIGPFMGGICHPCWIPVSSERNDFEGLRAPEAASVTRGGAPLDAVLGQLYGLTS